MAITFPTVFQSSIATDPAATAAGYLTPTRYNQGCSIAGLSSTSGALLYSTDATTLAQDGTNLLYTTSSGPVLKVGSGSTTLKGWTLGYDTNNGSGFSALYTTAVTPSGANYTLLEGGNITYLRGINQIRFVAGSLLKAQVNNTAGEGVVITSGIATQDLQALSATQTWNASGVAFTGAFKLVVTDTASAAGSLIENVLGGASGTTILRQTTKAGTIYGGDANFLIGSKATLNNGAAAQTATLTNGPAAGNPTKWIPIDDNGTTRYIPAW